MSFSYATLSEKESVSISSSVSTVFLLRDGFIEGGSTGETKRTEATEDNLQKDFHETQHIVLHNTKC